jgi:uncharacterized membrane protein
MDSFSTALAAFVLLHVGVSATGLRSEIVSRIGERPYRGLFSLASAILLAWMIWGFHAMRTDDLDPLNASYWRPPEWVRPIGQSVIALGLLLAFTGVLTPGPTFVGFEGALDKPESARGVLRITRNPFLWGVAIWGAGHMLINPELFAPMLFGGLGLMSLFGARSIDRKGAARDPEGWAKFAAVTSNIPFAAIVQGRNTLKFGEMAWRLLAALAITVLIALSHMRLFGVPALPVQI